jgi:hypothetical protein
VPYAATAIRAADFFFDGVTTISTFWPSAVSACIRRSKRNAPYFVVPNRGYFRLRDTEKIGRCGLGKGAATEDVVDFLGKNHFRRKFFRIRQAYIEQHILSATVR